MAHFLFYEDIISNDTSFPLSLHHESLASADNFYLSNNFIPKDAKKYIYNENTKQIDINGELFPEIYKTKILLPKEIPEKYEENFPENLFFHMHNAVEITVITEGSIIYITNNSFIELEKGEFVLFSPNTPHTWTSAKPGIPVQAVSFYFYPNMLSFQRFNNYESNLISKFLNTSLRYYLMKHEKVLTQELFYLLMECDQEYSEKKIGYQTNIRSTLLKIICKMVREDYNNVNLNLKTYPNQLNASLEYINENLCNKITLKEVSKIIHMTPNYFSYYFKENMGVSLVKYITRLRLSKAYEMLRYTLTPISQIAEECGISTLSNFNKAFKEIYHFSPSQIRKQEDK